VLAHLVGIWILLTGGKVKSRGIILNVNNKRITNAVKYHLLSQKYEIQEFNLIQKYFQPNIDVVEFGGGIGFISCIIGKKINPLNKHIVVEPNPFLLRLLNSNRILNSCSFEILNRAYSSTPGFVTLDVSGPFESSRIDINSSDTVQIESITLRDIIDQFVLDQFLLIIDIEGAEFDLLKQEFDTLVHHCPLILIEFHDQGLSRVKFVSKLESAGYSSFENGDVYTFIREDGFKPIDV